jgi:hypothetical protein
MRKLVYLFLGCFMFSCGDSAPSEVKSDADSGNKESEVTHGKFTGSFVGAFGNNKITIQIATIENGKVEGRSIVAGNDRPFSGTYSKIDGGYSFVANEPGDNKDDGQFNFELYDSDPNTLRGSWRPNNKPANKKDYVLIRKQFVYQANVGMYPEASNRLLEGSDLEMLSLMQLGEMRNEIFARHGYSFKKLEYRQLFEKYDWYVPVSTNVEADLTQIEKANVAKIKEYESYYKDLGEFDAR